MIELIVLLNLLNCKANLIEVSEDELFSKVEHWEVALILYYITWNKNSQKAKEAFEKASEFVLEKYSILFLKINCDYENLLCSRLKLDRIPLIRAFKRGRFLQDYEGPFEPEPIAAYSQSFTESSFLEAKFFFQPKKSLEWSKVPKHEDTEKIQLFLEKNHHGLIKLRTVSNKDQFRKPFVIIFFNLDLDKNKMNTLTFRDGIFQVAKKFKQIQIVFNSAYLNYELEEFGFDPEDDLEVPKVVARSEFKLKFRMEKDFSFENFEEFVVDLLDGALEPFVRSLDVPGQNIEVVKELVGKTLKQEVLDSDKISVVLFYSNFCEFCWEVLEMFCEVALAFRFEDMNFFQMNVLGNDVYYLFEVERYPVVYVKEKDKMKPVRFEGEMRFEELVGFVEKFLEEKELRTIEY